MMHPISALKTVYGYHYDRDSRSARRDPPDQFGRKKYSNWLTEYFNSLYTLNRIELYAMYKEMDQDPLVSAILDTFAGAAAQPNTEGGGLEAGRRVWIQSKNQTVQTILMNLLDNLGIEDMVFPAMRTLTMFGDHYEGVIATRNDGVVRLEPYDPWELAVVLDDLRRISAYGASDGRGEVINPASVVPFYQVAHFRMPLRFRTDLYGVNSSILYNSRDYWVEFQWCMDKVWIERQQRKASRLAVAMDIGGASTEDAFEACKEWEERLYRDVYYNPQDGLIKAGPSAWGEQRDIVLPNGGDNRTTIQQLQSTGPIGALDDLNFFLRRFFGAVKFPPGYLGLDIDSGYRRDASIEKQDVAFSQACMRPQQAFISAIARLCMVHLAYLNLSPKRAENQFTVMMMPVSTWGEIERKELVAMRQDLMDRAMSMGRDNGWNKEFWDRYVMTEYGRMPEAFVDELLKKDVKVEQVADAAVGGDSSFKERLSSSAQTLLEGMSTKTAETLMFYREGSSHLCSSAVPFRLTESEVRETVQIPKFTNQSFETILRGRMEKKARARAARVLINDY
jgi:hypothetical protein